MFRWIRSKRGCAKEASADGLKSGCIGVELFEPEGEVKLVGGEVAGGDQAEDGVLNFSGEFGEGVTGAGAGDGVEFVEA